MDTYFAPIEREDETTLQQHFKDLCVDPLIENLMRVSNGLFAVLNEYRQIIALNDSFLKMMGLDNALDALGLRPGEFVKCVHATEMPAGCGTSSYCSTCGAVLAILASLQSDSPKEETCALSIEKDGKKSDLFLQVRCSPLVLDNKKFILFFLQDISVQQQRAYLERIFFHDISNLLQGIMGTSEIMLRNGADQNPIVSSLHNMVERMAREISVQKSLSKTFSHTYQPLYHNVGVTHFLEELGDVYQNHAMTKAHALSIEVPNEDIYFTTDLVLVNRILVNMVTNALEASEQNDAVTVFVESEGNMVSFCVRNKGIIPEEIGRRIFQRNFSTKKTLGRGLGTYSMKYFGETVLGGRVSFTSNEKEGTTFRFAIPRNLRRKEPMY